MCLDVWAYRHLPQSDNGGSPIGDLQYIPWYMQSRCSEYAQTQTVYKFEHKCNVELQVIFIFLIVYLLSFRDKGLQ